MNRGRGASLMEVLVVLLLSMLVAGAAWTLLQHQVGAVTRAQDLSERLDVSRIVRNVLGEELRSGRGGRDWGPPAGDSVQLRAFRGVALPCGGQESPDGDLLMTYRGLRQPDPAKDSLLLLLGDGTWRVVDLTEAPSAPDEDMVCPSGSPAWNPGWWSVHDLDAPPVMARIFERGSYHLADGAFRYRTGDAGRQPLTPERLQIPGSSLTAGVEGSAMELRLRFRLPFPGTPPTWATTLRSPGP